MPFLEGEERRGRTGIRSGYFERMRSASALRFSVQRGSDVRLGATACGAGRGGRPQRERKGDAPKTCSSLNLERTMLAGGWLVRSDRCGSVGEGCQFKSVSLRARELRAATLAREAHLGVGGVG